MRFLRVVHVDITAISTRQIFSISYCKYVQQNVRELMYLTFKQLKKPLAFSNQSTDFVT
jgi:hypothetical protein